MFRRYHYLNDSILSCSQCFIAIQNNYIVDFFAVIHSIGFYGLKQAHRIVVLPDFQGTGIATAFVNYVGEYYKKQKTRLHIISSSPPMAHALLKNKSWRLIRKGRIRKQAGIHKNEYKESANRITYTFE